MKYVIKRIKTYRIIEVVSPKYTCWKVQKRFIFWFPLFYIFESIESAENFIQKRINL